MMRTICCWNCYLALAVGRRRKRFIPKRLLFCVVPLMGMILPSSNKTEDKDDKELVQFTRVKYDCEDNDNGLLAILLLKTDEEMEWQKLNNVAPILLKQQCERLDQTEDYSMMCNQSRKEEKKQDDF